MESSYGIGVKNRYECFYDDEDDPLDVIKQHDEDKKKKKETKQQQEKENKSKVTATASTKAKIIAPTKKGPKDNPPVKTQEPPVSTKNAGENNRARGQKVSSDRMVKSNSNIRDENKDLEQKNRRNREDNRPERGPPSGEFRERGGFDRNSQWDGERNDRGGENKEPRSGDASEPRRGRGGFGGTRGGFRGRGRGRGGGGGYDSRGKREFERLSGSDKSGVKPVDKREGAGSHNWGTIRDEIDHINNTATLSDEAGEWADKPEEPVEVQSEKEGEQPIPAAEDEAGEKPLIDEAAKQMTLDEWKKEQEKNRAVPQFNIRKPGEGEDNSQWKKTYVLKKKDVDSDSEELDEDDDEEYGRRGRAKHVVHDIEINYVDSRRGRGGRGRGTRGGPRGGGGRGSFSRGTDGPSAGPIATSPGAVSASGGGVRENARGRGSRSNKTQSAPKVDDENDFPSLVAA
ncbi:hypothetical protein CHUAL_014143 [Chamberlinius hualienensis]